MTDSDLDVSRLDPEMRRLWMEALVAMVDEEDPRGYADLVLEAVRVAPSPWAYGRYFLFDRFGDVLKTNTALFGRSDKKAFLTFLNDEEEPALFPLVASYHLAAFHDTVSYDRERSAEYLRRALDIANKPMDAEDMDRRLVVPSGENATVRDEVERYVDLAKKRLRHYEDPFEGDNDHSEENRGFMARLRVGGGACDCCGKTREQLGVARLQCCSRCKMAYYCGPDCQRKQWKAGHKKACRRPGGIRVGDDMRLRELVARSELNGKFVRVLGCDTEYEGRWIVEVTMPGLEQVSIAAENLFHLRSEM